MVHSSVAADVALGMDGAELRVRIAGLGVRRRMGFVGRL